MSTALEKFAPDVWVKQYPIRYSGCTFPALMTVIRLKAGHLLIHSPCEIDSQTKAEIADLGPTAFIVAPGTYHYLHVISCQKAFPDAKTFLCPGIERKRPNIPFEGILDGTAQPEWDAELDQVLVEGSRFIWEVAFLHRASRTLILVDLIENIGDSTPGTNWVLRFFWKVVFRMWNRPKPAPEYQLGWRDKTAARRSLSRILSWDFERVLIAHGEPIVTDARETLRKAWRGVLAG